MYVNKLPVTTFAGLRYDDDEDILFQRSGAYVHLCPTGGGLTGSTAERTPCVPQMVDHDAHRHSRLFGQACGKRTREWRGEG